MRDAAVAAMRAVVTGDQSQAQAARDRAADALAKAENISADQAKQRVQQYETQYRQTVDTAKAKAKELADAARKSVAGAALLAMVALLLGAIAAWFGGRTGAVDPTLTRHRELFVMARRMRHRQ